MNPTPLVVTTIPNHPYIEGLWAQPHPIEILSVDQAEKETEPHKVVFMRCGYALEKDPELAVRAARLEQRYCEHESIVLNSTECAMLGDRKDWIYPELSVQGIPVPFHIPNPTLQECRITLESWAGFPLIIRTADQFCGKGLHLCHDEEEIEEALKKTGRRNMMVEYIKDKIGDYHARCRVYVIGGKVDMVSRNISRNWIVAPMTADFFSQYRDDQFLKDSQRINEEFVLPPEVAEDAIRVGEAMRCEIYAVDFLLSGDDHYFIDFSALYHYTREYGDIYPESQREHRGKHFERVAKYLNDLCKN